MCVFLIVGLTNTLALAADLEPGSSAPPLSIKTWYKGSPVKAFKKDKIYVVEFWATWCGPCRHSIPHVTELAAKHKDITFIGVGVREDDDGQNIKKFVAEMGNKMNYNVGYSGNKIGMYLTWMQATGQTFIPNAYIVRNNKILWIGHPLDMDQPLAEIKAGKFNVAAAKTKFHDAKVKAKADNEIEAARSEIFKLIQAGMDEDAKTKIDQLRAKYPTAIVDDLRKYRESQGLVLGERQLLELLKNSKFAEAQTKTAELKQRYPSFKSERVDFIILAKTDHAAWTNKLHELIAKNDAESFQTIGGAMFRPGSATEVTSQAQEIVEALLATVQKDELDKYWAISFYYRAIGDFKKSLTYLDNAISAFPVSKYKDLPQSLEALKRFRFEIVEKLKG